MLSWHQAWSKVCQLVKSYSNGQRKCNNEPPLQGAHNRLGFAEATNSGFSCRDGLNAVRYRDGPSRPPGFQAGLRSLSVPEAGPPEPIPTSRLGMLLRWLTPEPNRPPF